MEISGAIIMVGDMYGDKGIEVEQYINGNPTNLKFYIPMTVNKIKELKLYSTYTFTIDIK